MNRRTFLKLTTYTFTWLTQFRHHIHQTQPAKAQTENFPFGAYGSGEYGQGIYPEFNTQLYLPLITKQEN